MDEVEDAGELIYDKTANLLNLVRLVKNSLNEEETECCESLKKIEAQTEEIFKLIGEYLDLVIDTVDQAWLQ